MSNKPGHVPDRLLPLVQAIANKYLAKPYPTVGMLAREYQTSRVAILAVLAVAGASRQRGESKRLRNTRNGNPVPLAKKAGMTEERVLCSKPHLEKPRMCILRDYPGSCKSCRNRKEEESGYRSCM